VTNNVMQASRCADRTAFFLQGKLVEEGPTQEIFVNPKEKLTHEYVSGRFG
jgi:phosphate transport system ATP-binding protein